MDTQTFRSALEATVAEVGLEADPHAFGALLADHAGGAMTGARVAALVALRGGIVAALERGPVDRAAWITRCGSGPDATMAVDALIALGPSAATSPREHDRLSASAAPAWGQSAIDAAAARGFRFLAAVRSERGIEALSLLDPTVPRRRLDGDRPAAVRAITDELRRDLEYHHGLALVGYDLPNVLPALGLSDLVPPARVPVADLYVAADLARRRGSLELDGPLGLDELAAAVGRAHPHDHADLRVEVVAEVWTTLLQPRLAAIR